MLTKLLPDQIAKFWPVIKYAIEESLPPTVDENPDKMNRILSASLSGGLDVWAAHKRIGEEIKLEAILITKLLYDDASGTGSLLLYCLYGYTDVSRETYIEGISTLAKYARSKGCSRIVAYSSIPAVIQNVKSLGASADYTFISFDLKKIV